MRGRDVVQSIMMGQEKSKGEY